MLAPLLAIPLIPLVAAASKPSYSIDNLPHTSEEGQTGYNDCGTTDSQSSMCQTVHLNSVTDFCLWAPPTPGVEVGASEEYEVAWCTAAGHGARLMPEGTITSAHYLKTPHYTQITGTGDFTKINIKAGDEGGELDPHGATGLGNPIGSLVFANGQQVKEWTSFISDTEYCIRWCNVNSADDWLWCQHVYDVMGCHWNEPGNYDSGFDTCDAESTQHPPGIYEGTDGKLTTFSQGDGHTPPAMAPGASSNCQAVATVGGNAVAAPAATTSASSAVSSAASSSDVSSSGQAIASSSSSSSSSVPSSSSLSSSGSSDVGPSSSSSVGSVSASSSDSALSSSSFVTSTLSSGASSSALSSGSSTVDPSSAVSSISSGVTVTSTSTLPSASAPVSTAGQQAAASTSSKTNGSARLAAGTLGSLLAVAGAIAFFA